MHQSSQRERYRQARIRAIKKTDIKDVFELPFSKGNHPWI